MDDAHDRQACDASVASAFAILGKRWNGMILDALGAGPLSFSALKRGVPKISDTTLSDRLTELNKTGLIERNVQPGPPVSVTYELTPAGQKLVPILEQIGQWAFDNLTKASLHRQR